MQEVLEKIIEKLESKLLNLTLHKSERNKGFNDAIHDAIEIVKQEANRYEDCYKDCGECEAYDEEKHHCPKFCKVITEAVKEIEENRNGWIPCSERLPEEYGDYPVTYSDGKTGLNSFITYAGMNRWRVCSSASCVKEVIAWRDIKIEPYQPKGVC